MNRIKRLSLFVFIVAVAAVFSGNSGSPALARQDGPGGGRADYVEGELLVKYKKDRVDLATASGRNAANALGTARSTEKKDELTASNTVVLKIKDNKSVEQKLVEFRNDPRVEYAEPNYRRYPAVISTDDTHRALLWGLDNTGQTVGGSYSPNTGTADKDIDAPEAWAINEGTNSTVIVAVLDTGVAYNHPDLLANMWDGSSCKNENGVAISGGCNYGYDYEENDVTPLPSTSTHGTHVAGTVAAVKNNTKGIIGVAPQAKIMAIKFGLTVAQEVKAIDFAIQNGAKVINASYGGSSFSQSERDAIDRFRTAGGIFVAAAGNNAANNETTHFYPSDHTLDNIISVAATDANDALATFSNYGATSVDVGAPGTNIYSTVASTITSSNQTFEGVTLPALPAGWSATGNWQTIDFSGDKVLAPDPANVPYLANANTTVTSSSVNMSGPKGLSMNLTTRCDAEYITNGWKDYIALEVSGNGTNYTEIFRWDEAFIDSYLGAPDDGTGAASATISGISVSNTYLTSTFSYRFRWVTDGSNTPNSAYEGCWIDDISFTTYSDGADEQYGYLNGTSMASPHVAGLVALVRGFNPNLTMAQARTAVLNSGDAAVALSGTTTTGKRVNAQSALQSVNPAKAITSFNFVALDPDVIGTVNETNKTVALTVPFGTNVTALVPTIVHTGASVSPNSGVAQNFTNPVVYTVTAADSSTQPYTVTVTVAADPDIAAVAADKAALTDASIKGANPDLANVTVALAALPATGGNGSTITWVSNATSVVSNNGQTVNRPLFSAGNASVTMTATLTKGAVTDTKAFSLTVLKLPASNVATVTSSTYTVSTGGTANETITGVPFATSKAAFLAAVTAGEAHQTRNSTNVSDPVVTGNTLVITAENGTTIVTYTITALLNPAKAITSFNFVALDPDVIGTVNETNKTVALTVPFGTNVTALVPTIVHTGASVSPNSGVAQNFTSPVVYTVTAADSSTQPYTVTVTVALNPAKDITSFVFAAFDPDVVGTIVGTNITLRIPFGSSVTALVPTVVHTGASVSPNSGVAQNFTSPVTYTVTAADSTTKAYAVTVYVRPPAPVITSVGGDGVITNAEKTAIHVIGTAQADALVTAALTNGANSRSGTQQLTGGATTYDITIDGTAALPAALADGTISASVTSTDANASISDAATTTASQDTVAPTVIKLGDDSADVTLSIGNTDLVFSETLSVAAKTAVQNALTAGTDKTLAYAWTGATLTVTATEAATFANDVMVNASDVAGNTAVGLLIIDSKLAANQAAPDGTGAVTLNNTTSQAVITHPTQAVTITLGSGTTDPTIDLSSFILNGTGLLPQITINSANGGTVVVAIPAGTTVTSVDTAWSGVMNAPRSATVSIPSGSGETSTVGIAIDIGTSVKLSFSKGVRISFSGQSGKKAGYERPSLSFTEIATVCPSDDQAMGDALAADGDCKYSTSGDMAVWTKHFTAFATYGTSVVSGGGGGGGGGSGGGGGGGTTPTTTVMPTTTPTGTIGQNATPEQIASLTETEKAAPATDPTSSGSYVPATATTSTPTIDVDKGLLTPPALKYCISGTLVKGVSSSAVYYCGRDGKRYVFFNEKVFYTWFPDFSRLVEVSDVELANISLGGNVTYKPGVRMVKIQSDPKVYVVSRGGVLRWVATEAMAVKLYGAGWNKKIDDVSDSIFFSYRIGEPLDAADVGL